MLDSDGNIAHRSYLVSRNFKFPFLKKREKELGPCFTNKDHRGKGIYPAVIEKASEDKIVYMLVREDNLSSIRGIEKAGAVQVGYVKKNRFGQWIKYD